MFNINWHVQDYQEATVYGLLAAVHRTSMSKLDGDNEKYLGTPLHFNASIIRFEHLQSISHPLEFLYAETSEIGCDV